MAQHGHGVQPLTDVGAGSGFFSKEMTKERIFINVLCIDPNCTREQLT
jgi:2-polyprenyl-3-methyl-5-hydroxy-6-metoxy-1,4-benzoquinol methylase